MAIGFEVTTNVYSLTVDVTITGMTPGVRYDVYRLAHALNADEGVYMRMLPDRRTYWSAVAHRIGWQAPGVSASFRDYGAPMKPFRYFIVETTAVGPHEWDFADGDYPIERGFMSKFVPHLRKELDDLFDVDDLPVDGNLVLRSTSDLSLWTDTCVYDLDVVRYTARGTEFPIIGRQFPIYVADTREARRGTITLFTRDLAEYEDIRSMVFPQSGRIAPVWMHAAKPDSLLLDDMLVVPLDVTVEQAGKADPAKRFITVDFVEIDPTAGLPKRTGDNDDLVNAPTAKFSASTFRPARKQRVTLTDRSTGQIETWVWAISDKAGNDARFRYGPGPHQVSWSGGGNRWVTLRVSGRAGASSIRKKFRVG